MIFALESFYSNKIKHEIFVLIINWYDKEKFIGVYMKNILVIGMVVVAIAYMFVVMKDKYDNIKETNSKIEQRKTQR